MSITSDSSRPASVGPPGWPQTPAVNASPSGAVAASASISTLSALSGQSAVDAAVRWRLRAATIDNIAVCAVYAVVCAIAHWRLTSLAHWPVFLVLGVVYHFVFEARDGQTPGKRLIGIRVVDVDGGPASARGIAARSLLRMIDQLPLWYASGLISMVRTGPARRQRIGDVAGRTKVVAVDGRAARRGTPGWYLYTATVAAVGFSVLVGYTALSAGNGALSQDQRAQFIDGCAQRVSVSTCECLLDQLQAEGYSSYNRLMTLLQQAQAAVAAGRPGDEPTALMDATYACRGQ